MSPQRTRPTKEGASHGGGFLVKECSDENNPEDPHRPVEGR
jgi:hypothetical protein